MVARNRDTGNYGVYGTVLCEHLVMHRGSGVVARPTSRAPRS